ncbi:MAG TPA: hypothetical protein VFN97_10535 [Actinospica sp.]|nr:hypothetical protein [Actinospica sp.]
MEVNTDRSRTTVRGLIDNRSLDLACLAEQSGDVSENLRNVLRTEDERPVHVAAFQSSI